MTTDEQYIQRSDEQYIERCASDPKGFWPHDPEPPPRPLPAADIASLAEAFQILTGGLPPGMVERRHLVAIADHYRDAADAVKRARARTTKLAEVA